MQNLREYFHANGSGVALPYLEKTSSVLKSAIALYQKDTQVLLDLYGALSEKVCYLVSFFFFISALKLVFFLFPLFLFTPVTSSYFDNL